MTPEPGNRIFVDFDGVMVNATVVINDQTVSSHQGGYLPLSAELTGQVTAGDNLLAVIVDGRNLAVPPMGVGNGPRTIDFFQPGGIYRDVNLRIVPQVFLSDLFALPVDVLSPQRRVDVECTIDSASTTHVTGTLLVELLDGNPRSSPRRPRRSAVSSPGVITTKLSLTGLGPVSLWSTDNPKLYTVQATLTFPGVGSHVLSRRIGFREASFQPDGFYLNGERLQLFGLNRHQLYPYAGMAMPARVQRKDAEILKNEFNCNMVRCSHYPAVAALPRRLRRARAAGLGRGAGLAQRERHPGLAGPGGAERARHGEPGPEPAVGRHLGHPAQRDTRPPRPLGRHQAGRRPARRLTAQLGGDGLPPRGGLERGCLRVQRLPTTGRPLRRC